MSSPLSSPGVVAAQGPTPTGPMRPTGRGRRGPRVKLALENRWERMRLSPWPIYCMMVLNYVMGFYMTSIWILYDCIWLLIVSKMISIWFKYDFRLMFKCLCRRSYDDLEMELGWFSMMCTWFYNRCHCYYNDLYSLPWLYVICLSCYEKLNCFCLLKLFVLVVSIWFCRSCLLCRR